MIIFGIDPGLQLCGYAAVEVNGGREKLLEAGTFSTNSNRPLEVRLNQIAVDMESLLQKFRPDIVAVEDLYSHYAHPKTAILMGHARGVILERAYSFGVEVKSFAATKIKKSITGNGRAGKGQMQRSIQTVLGLAALPEPADVADAIAAALCCGNSLAGVGKI